MTCVSKIGVGYILVTNGVIVNTTNVVFGIDPNVWKALPCEGVALLKIRQVVPTAGQSLPAAIAVPTRSTVSTVGDASSCCTVNSIPVINPVNTAVTGLSMTNNTERLVYFNKPKGIIRLMDCCVGAEPATAAATRKS